MIRQDFIPDRFRVLSGSMLKLIAVVSMFIDHVGVHLVDQSIILLQFGTYKLTLYRLMRDLGRFAFPIFCFLLIEGFLHTRSKVAFCIRAAKSATESVLQFWRSSRKYPSTSSTTARSSIRNRTSFSPCCWDSSGCVRSPVSAKSLYLRFSLFSG